MDKLIKYSWVFGVLGALSMVVFGSLWFLFREQTPYVTGSGVATIVFLILYLALDRERIGDTMSSRSFLYGSGSALMMVMLTAVCVFGFAIAERHDKTWDLTSTKQFTLSEQTVQIVQSLDEPVEIVAFFQDGSAQQREFQNLVKRYEEHSAALSVRFVDPLRSPLEARKFELESDYGTVVLIRGETKKKMVGSFDEDALTKHLVLLTKGEQHRICWSLGHGEPDPDDDYREDGAAQVVMELESLNYQVTKTFIMSGGIDRECEALVIFKPIIDWFPFEREALAAYIAEGGAAFLALEPGMTPELAQEMKRYGMTVGDDLVLDKDPEAMLGSAAEAGMLVLGPDNFAPHVITRNMGAIVVMGVVRSVSPDQLPGVRAQTLLESGLNAWAELDLEGKRGPYAPDPDEKQGTISLMVLSEIDDPAVIEVAEPTKGENEAAIRSRVLEVISYQVSRPPETLTLDQHLVDDLGAKPEDMTEIARAVNALFGIEPDLSAAATVGQVIDIVAAARLNPSLTGAPEAPETNRAVPDDFAPEQGGRVVVVGDADFANNQLVNWGNNKDLFLNTIAWMVDEEEQIGERPESGDTLEVTALGAAFMALLSFFLFPGAALVAALLAVVRRWFL